MKYMLAVCAVFSAINSAQAEVVCSNGTFEEMGDRHYQIELLEDVVNFRPYEGFFSVNVADITQNSGTFSIVNKPVEIISEGTDYAEELNATLIFNEAEMKLNAAISLEKGPFQTYEMNCSKK